MPINTQSLAMDHNGYDERLSVIFFKKANEFGLKKDS